MIIRKVLIVLLLVFMIFCCYSMITSGFELGALKINSYEEVSTKSSELDMKTNILNKNNTDTFEDKKKTVQAVMEKYISLKNEYNSLMLTNANENAYQSEEIYDVGFLWTITGAYASKENLILQLDIYKSKLNIAHDISTGSMSYTICDLDFTVYGQYSSIYDFLYSIEEDDRLGFEIRNVFVERNPLRVPAPTAPKLPLEVSTQEEWDQYLIDLKNYNMYPYPLKCKFTVIGIPVDRNTLSTLTPSIDADDVTTPTVEVEIKNSEFNRPRSAEETEQGANTTNTTNTNTASTN